MTADGTSTGMSSEAPIGSAGDGRSAGAAAIDEASFARPGGAVPTGAADRGDTVDDAEVTEADATSVPAGGARGIWQAVVGWLDPRDRETVAIWLLSRLAVAVAVSAAAWNLADQPFKPPFPALRPFAERWIQWDFVHFQAVAEVWYGSGQPTGVPLEAFFPGFPATLWLGHALGLSYAQAGLLVSLVAGMAAVLALRRLGDLDYGAGVGNRAVLLLVLAPMAVFLAAPYTEALFLGLAIPAWLAARRGHWPLAALLACAAGTVRVSGIFLGVALVVEFVTSRRRAAVTGTGAGWGQAPWLLLSFAGTAAYGAYLWRLTGDPLRWLHAQAEGWGRRFTSPLAALEHTWAGAFSRPDFNANYSWMFRAELIAMFVGVVLTIGLLVWRRWGEATFVGLQVVAFGTSYWYFSVPRATLLWWPLWLGLAWLTYRYRWLLWVYVSVCAPVMIVWLAAFTLGGHWTG